MVFYRIETIIFDKFAEKECVSYLSFPNTEAANKYFTAYEEDFKKCRRHLKSNRIGTPIWKEVAYIPKRTYSGDGKNNTAKAKK